MATERFALTDRAIRIIPEDKIQSANRAGEFDNLPGLGEPFDWCDEPYDPNWWVRRKLKDEKLAARVNEWSLIREGKNVVDGMVEYHKQFVDRDAIRENPKLSIAQRIAKAQAEASRVDVDNERKVDARSVEFQRIAELKVLREEIARLNDAGAGCSSGGVQDGEDAR